MPVSADNAQFSMIKENADGSLPASPSMMLILTSGEGVTFTPQTSDSTTISGAGRFQKPSNVVGVTVSGDINFEAAPAPWFWEAIAGVLANEWGECPLTGSPGGAIDTVERNTVGDAIRQYTIEKRWPNEGFVSGTLPSVAVGAPTTNSPTLTFTSDAQGTGVVWVDIEHSPGLHKYFEIEIDGTATTPITADQIATAVAAKIAADPLFSGTTSAATEVTLAQTGGATFANVTSDVVEGRYFYQRYKHVTFSTMSLTANPNATVTGSFGIVGGTPEITSVPLENVSYVSAGNPSVFTASQLEAITVGILFGMNSHCFTTLSINLNSNNRGIPCLGTIGDRETVVGSFSADLSATVYFNDQEVLHATLNNESIGDGHVTFSNADNDILRFDFYEMKVTAEPPTVSGAGQDALVPMTIQPSPVKVCESGGNEWNSGIIISQNNTDPSLPA